MNRDQQLEELRQIIESAEISLQQARNILADLTGDEIVSSSVLDRVKSARGFNNGEDQIVEGVFDGQAMIGPDGKQYSMPANYASKSKLVEGDMLKLTIKPDGTFLFKQIGPVDRERVKGKLAFDEQEGLYKVLADGKAYKVLTASVTYFKGEDGDEVIILVPKDSVSTWAAVENVIKMGNESDGQETGMMGNEETTHEDVEI